MTDSRDARPLHHAVRNCGPVPSIVAVIVALEAVVVVGVAIVYALQLGQAGPVGLPGRLFLLAVMVGAAMWQGWVAWSFARGRAWTRAAVVVWQLFQIILAVPMVNPANESLTVAFGWALLVPGAAAILLIFSGASMRHVAATEELGRERRG